MCFRFHVVKNAVFAKLNMMLTNFFCPKNAL
jgi:hypothetical protein